jgi:hypothetical protein
MRRYLIAPALLAMLVFGAAQSFAQTATVVTHSGQLLRGQLLQAGSDGDVMIRFNGRDRQIPLGDVMMIDFLGDGRNIPQSESARANQSDGLVVLRNGRMLGGRVADFDPSANRVVIASNFGDRTVGLNQVARIYFGNLSGYDQGGPSYNSDDGYYRGDRYGRNGRYDQYGQPASGGFRTLRIPTNEQWTDSGIDVRRGEAVHFRASGNVMLSQNGNDYGSPSGANNGRLAGNSPLPGVTGGMLIGRVGNSRPFVIGRESDVTMPANGRLFLGINDDYVGDNEGNFVVDVTPR